jgi:hypothetical protein
VPNEPSASTSTSTNSVAAVPARYGCNFGQIEREAVTALLALAIAFVALWLLYDVHGVLKTGKPDNYDQHKEVLLLASAYGQCEDVIPRRVAGSYLINPSTLSASCTFGRAPTRST